MPASRERDLGEIMADRRMLWKNVCRSRKVNSLSDKAALLWTWTIPWFDRDGFIEAESDFLREMIFPKRNITENDIDEILIEIFNSGLWIPHINNEEKKLVAFDPKFNKFQTIQYDREGKSDFKGKCSKITLEQLTELYKSRGIIVKNSDKINSDLLKKSYPQGTTSVSIENDSTLRPIIDNSKTTLTKDKIEEVKLSKVSIKESKEREYERKPKPTNVINDDQKKELATLCVQLSQKFKDQFNPFQWIQKNINLNYQTHFHVIRQMLKENGIDKPWAYANKIALIEEGNYNEKDFQFKATKDKADFMELTDKIKKL